MPEEQQRAAGVYVAAAEAWFEAHGLPYFVQRSEQRVHDALTGRRLTLVCAAAVGLAVLAGIATGLAFDVSSGSLAAAVVVVLVLLVYALAALHLQPIATWAVNQTLGSLNWLFPLVTRALPLLLLFITFLFINTEIWQVTSTLDRALLWLTVLFFAGLALLFLLVRLPEEVRQVSAQAQGERLRSICAGTPVAEVAATMNSGEVDVHLSGLQRANLVLVLLIAQALQVLMLSFTVLVFFLAFGKVAISDAVIRTWVGHEPTALPALGWLPVSNELFQASLFLAAFSGLYFTVYAVTDDTYRGQFFTAIATELERAIGVSTVYRTLTSSVPD